MAKKVKKAVIAAAGMGTRFLPQTKAMPKEMLPILDKPVIQLVVENLVQAGVEDIIIVTGATKRAIEDHFDRSHDLEAELQRKGKAKYAEQIKAIAELANFVYIRQKGTPVGNARPILNASHMLGKEPFFFFFADDFFTGEKGSAVQMLEAYNKTGKSIVALREVPEAEVSSYGVADIEEQVEDGLIKVKTLVEKPELKDAPSNLAVGCGFLLTPDVMPILKQEKVAPDGEIRVTDAVTELAAKDEVYGLTIKGEYHDTGNPVAYLKTLIDIALTDPTYSKHISEYLRSKL